MKERITMAFNNCNNCNFGIKTFGVGDVSKFAIDGSDRTQLNWKQISVPEVFKIPMAKPDIEHLDQVFVNVNLTSVRLVETPFSYTQRCRTATTFEIDAALAAVDAAVIDPALLTAITTAVNAILAIPLLPAIPQVTALQAALTQLTNATTNLTTVITAATTALAEPDLCVLDVVTILRTVEAALETVQTALNALIAAANALRTATASIPVVGGAVATAINTLLTAVNAVVDVVVDALQGIVDLIANLLTDAVYFTLNENTEGEILTGRKLIIEGTLKQKVVYTALVDEQSVHSAHFEFPFLAFLIPYANFEGLTYDPTINGFYFNPEEPIVPNLCENFSVETMVEDIFIHALDDRTIFKNTTLFLYARPAGGCN